MIDRATVERIKDAANIVDVVSEFVTLRKAGASYKGLCPFHDDTTPSFYVSPSRNICKCFACGKGGTPVDFLMEHEQMTYPEALRWLAKKYDIELHEREQTDGERQAESERESMYIVNEWAAKYFEDILHDTADGVALGMQYFRSRGFRDDIIRKFRLGYCQQSRTAMSSAAVAAGYKEVFLVKTGLCYEREDGKELRDRFAGRVIFPWLGINGKIIGFGGRLLDKRTKGVNQKYVNSPDSEIYHKEKALYGIFQAKRAITKENLVYMVEGYTDVISMHQCGIENVVANSGTALSNHQIHILRRFTPNIVLLYDGDAAGIHAALRGTDMLLAEGMNIKVLVLPDDDDPDSFARKHTAEYFKKYIESHQTDFIQFKASLMLQGVTDPIRRSEAITSIIRSISVIPDQIVRATYIADCSQRLGVNEATLISSMNKMIRSDREQRGRASVRPNAESVSAARPSQGAQSAAAQREADLERMLIQAVIRHGDEVIYKGVETDGGGKVDLTVAQYISYDLGSDGLAFANSLYNRILEEACRHSGEEGFKAESYFIGHDDIDISRLAADVAIDKVRLSQTFQVKAEEDTLRNGVRHLIFDFKMAYIARRMREIRAQITQSADDGGKVMELMNEYKDMQQLQSRLAGEARTSPVIQ